ncbi:hypothetical protein EJB05_31618, partial [Eragrostis curvula]
MAPATGSNGREEEDGDGAPKLPQAAPCIEAGLLGLFALSTAMTLAVSVPPPPWLATDAYFAALSGVFFAGVTQVAVSVWAADDDDRLAAGRKLVYASLVVPLLIAAVGMSVASLLQCTPLGPSAFAAERSTLAPNPNQPAAEDAVNSSTRSAAAFSDQAQQIIVPRAAGLMARVVSLSTCTKVGAISFTVGVVVGFTLKRRLRRWAAKLLKRIKDDD